MWYTILLAGGSGSRMGLNRNKVLLELHGEPVICRAARAFAPITDGMVVVVRPEDEKAIREALTAAGLMNCNVHIAYGGATRQESVWNGLCALPVAVTHVLVHDGARCLVDEATIRRAMHSAEACGSGVAAIPAVDTIKVVDESNLVSHTPTGLHSVLCRLLRHLKFICCARLMNLPKQMAIGARMTPPCWSICVCLFSWPRAAAAISS